uniref:Subtilisin-like serine protease Pen ch 13.0101 n=1 Tax=Penicillium rubens TaxID=1108849 RepID=PEN13_PENRB|nr:RecName: Full=Subtilisin-like serine protease Pen ch 13.0101; AltName: Full=Alkaline serine protease; AltName: Full=Allergen Pen n 13; AltName: Allergen=Pen ch 13.0101; Flags: Precursor [Penicillium rubens]AAF23726.1 allergen Pen n 13 [Penicillium chrysogenum]
MGFLKVLATSLATLAVVDAGTLLTASNTDAVIPSSYIVVMNDDVSTAEFSTHREWATNVHARLSRRKNGETGPGKHFEINGLKGYTASFDENTAKDIANDPAVKYIEPDMIVNATANVVQSNVPSWGLARISSKRTGTTSYTYDSTAGEGVVFYGVDTGIDISHSDFGGRAKWGTNVVDNDNTDGNGHGTHTASTAAGSKYGVAKKATLVAVKVLGADGSGTNSGVISGMDWAVKDAKSRGANGKYVMNTSLGGEFSKAVNDAAANVVKSGIFLSVAAGNEAENASNSSPASAAEACTIAASTSTDGSASFTNFGSVVDLYAPGQSITAAYPGGGSKTLSGTSMAAPHVAGVAAYLMALEGVSAGNACARIVQLATSSISRAPSGTTSKLLYNGINV